MNLPTKITVVRLVLTVFIVLILCIPFSYFGFNFPKYDVNGVIVELNYIIAGFIFIIAKQDAQKRIVSLQGEISALPHKLVAEDSAADVFSHIIIENPTCSTTETGAVVVEATFSVDPNYRIYDTVKPVIDGCIAARILRGTERIGSVYFVLPTYGVREPCRMKAVCTKTTGLHATYSVRFEPQYLWAMEK